MRNAPSSRRIAATSGWSDVDVLDQETRVFTQYSAGGALSGVIYGPTPVDGDGTGDPLDYAFNPGDTEIAVGDGSVDIGTRLNHKGGRWKVIRNDHFAAGGAAFSPSDK